MNQPNDKPLKLGVLISGGGTTMVNLAQRIDAGELDAEIVFVACSNATCDGFGRALELGLTVDVIPRNMFDDTQSFSENVFDQLRKHGVQLVVLAGFLSLLKIPDDFAGRVMNIHPALLPKYGGKGMFGHHVHEAVLAAGDTESGCTVHFADNEYDHGPVILQKTVPVEPGDTPDTLAQRVMAAERDAYPEAIRMYIKGELAEA